MMGVVGGLLTSTFAAAAPTVSVHPSWVDVGTFSVAAAMVLSGAAGVVLARNAVHSALMLVMTLFGVAVLFVLLREPFLAAVQVIVYAGAIVVLFLFVIMFLGVDREENIATETLRGQRPLAIAIGLLGTTGLLLLGQVSGWTTGQSQVAGPSTVNGQSNVALLGKSIYTTYLFPFEATAALLIIAVVGAVVLARRPPGGARSDGEVVDDPVSASSTGGSMSGAADQPAGAATPTTTSTSTSTTATGTATAETPTPAPASREAAP
jgi:NADH-quinone oxidoreductase subunit J